MAEHTKQFDKLLGTLQDNDITLKLFKCSLEFLKSTSLVTSFLVKKFDPRGVER